MANKVLEPLQVSPASDGFNQAQLVMIDVSSQFGLAAGLAYQLSTNFSNEFATYPSLSSAITPGSSILVGDPRGGPVLLASAVPVDGSLATKQPIFTVPEQRVAVIQSVILRNASDSLATLSIAFGFNAGADDVIATAVHAGLTGAGLAKIVSPITAGFVLGGGGDVFGVIATVQQAATLVVDVLGYYYTFSPE